PTQSLVTGGGVRRGRGAQSVFFAPLFADEVAILPVLFFFCGSPGGPGGKRKKHSHGGFPQLGGLGLRKKKKGKPPARATNIFVGKNCLCAS
ncbi:hypothetical protein DNR41_27315, partial [Escherichia coli]|uniref:hypothetical protein n=1 Tax=Escherichia coli TaxID=562 RepID=UPI000DBC07B8